MQQLKTVERDIQERMKGLTPMDTCALFLLSLERRDGQGQVLDTEAAAEHTAGALSRFFRSTDVVGCMGLNRFAGFLSGRLSGSVVWEKAETLSEAVWFAEEGTPTGDACSYVGVYMFRPDEDAYEAVMRKAEWALEMAHRVDNRRFYIYATTGVDAVDRRSGRSAYSPQLLTNYIDEGVRLLSVDGHAIAAEYVSPGFYRRLALSGEEANAANVRIHQDDVEAYERDVRTVARDGGQRVSSYRVSREGGAWISCRVRILRIAESKSGATVLEISHNISGLERLKNQYEEKKEWLRFLSDETDFQLWEVDIKARTFRFMYSRDIANGRQTVYGNFPESLIETGIIHHDSAERFREFASDIYAGKSYSNISMVTQYRQTGCYGWSSTSYHMLYDEDGHPEKALGLTEDISTLPMQQSHSIQRRAMPKNLFPNLYCYLQANLSADATEKLQLEGRERIRLVRYQTYTDIIKRGISRMFSPEDGRRFAERFDRERLLNAHAQGKHWFYDSCQIVDSQGAIQWMSVGVNVIADPESDEVCMFAYMSLRNQQQKWETDAHCHAEHKLRTGVYTRAEADKMIRTLLGNGGHEMCALAVIHVGGAEELYGCAGQKWQEMLIALSVFMDTDCMLCDIGGGYIQVFFPRSVSRTQLKQRVEDAISFARSSMADVPEMHLMRIVAGVCCGDMDASMLEGVRRTACNICDMHAGEAMDMVIIADETFRWNGVELWNVNPDRLDRHQPEPRQLMTKEDKDVALDCMGIMLLSNSAEESISMVLERLGRYYSADRVYILALTDGGNTITMLNEWTQAGRHSLQQSMSGKRTSRFPVIARYAERPEPVLLSRKKDSAVDGAEAEIAWQYAIYPMPPVDKSQQLLCVENPRKSIAGMALLKQIAPYLAKERNRRSNSQATLSSLERLYALPNQHEYVNTVYGMDSDSYRSMGAVAVDIPDFSKLKERRGYEYGTRLLMRISEVLLEVFGKASIFHTREEEFIVLCPNLAYPAFINQCARAKQLVGRKYTGLFRLGCTWSDGIFQAIDLVNKARSIMICATPSDLSVLNLHDSDGWGDLLPEKPLAQGAGDGTHMMAYLQPKVDMRTGKVLGAEALLRVANDKGELLPHARMIQTMEEDGTISKVDYFVFDKVLDTLDRWGRQGYSPIRVTSNFSRKTLLSPTSLASVLAILSRYPDVPQNHVALEITETAGDLENHTVSDMMERFASYGLQFDLDDFGSSYSNMSMLADLHFRSVKLDRSLVRNISANQVSRMMVRDIAEICSSCGMLCIAEGVETQAQADALISEGCIYAQGYYYGRPMPIEEFEEKYMRN